MVKDAVCFFSHFGRREVAPRVVVGKVVGVRVFVEISRLVVARLVAHNGVAMNQILFLTTLQKTVFVSELQRKQTRVGRDLQLFALKCLSAFIGHRHQVAHGLAFRVLSSLHADRLQLAV